MGKDRRPAPLCYHHGLMFAHRHLSLFSAPLGIVLIPPKRRDSAIHLDSSGNDPLQRHWAHQLGPRAPTVGFAPRQVRPTRQPACRGRQRPFVTVLVYRGGEDRGSYRDMTGTPGPSGCAQGIVTLSFVVRRTYEQDSGAACVRVLSTAHTYSYTYV